MTEMARAVACSCHVSRRGPGFAGRDGLGRLVLAGVAVQRSRSLSLTRRDYCLLRSWARPPHRLVMFVVACSGRIQTSSAMSRRFRPEAKLETGAACGCAHVVEQILPLPSTKLVEAGKSDAVRVSVYRLCMASSSLSKAGEPTPQFPASSHAAAKNDANGGRWATMAVGEQRRRMESEPPSSDMDGECHVCSSSVDMVCR